MALTLRTLFLVVACVLFVVSGLGVGAGRYSLLSFGLFFFALSQLVP